MTFSHTFSHIQIRQCIFKWMNQMGKKKCEEVAVVPWSHCYELAVHKLNWSEENYIYFTDNSQKQRLQLHLWHKWGAKWNLVWDKIENTSHVQKAKHPVAICVNWPWENPRQRQTVWWVPVYIIFYNLFEKKKKKKEVIIAALEVGFGKRVPWVLRALCKCKAN